MQRGRDRQRVVTTPTEQPPRKLSGKRTAQLEHLESGAVRAHRRGFPAYRLHRARMLTGRNSQVHGQMGHRRRFRHEIDTGDAQLLWIMSCHESPLSAPGLPASRLLTPWRNAVTMSPCSNVIAMRRWRPHSPTVANCPPVMPKSGTARPPCLRACAGCSRAAIASRTVSIVFAR